MKMKTLALLAASGLMAASIAYVLPAFAEDAANDIDGSVPMQLAMGDDSGASTDSSAADNNAGTTDNGNGSGGADSSGGSAAGTPGTPGTANTGATSDQPAQGDDDY